jgi:flavin-dependent dehydrogenase
VAAERCLAEVGWPLPDGLAGRNWRGTAPLTRALRRPSAERVFAVGDAAGYVEPFTGEGMAWALAGAAAVAPLAAERWRPDLARHWAQTHRRLVARRQWLCRAAAAVLRRPWLLRPLVRLLAVVPLLAAPVVALLNRP